jgi:hypothetical protein
MTLYSFDFDDTLFHTMLPNPGEKIWQEKTGEVWPHRGWWSKPETLDIEIFDTPKNDWTYKEYLKTTEETDSLRILATGRLQKVPGMRENIEKIINEHNFSFDEIWVINSDDEKQKGNGKNGIYLNWGGDTFAFKTELFSKLIEITGCDAFVMYDDREEHLPRFEEWAQTIEIPVTIVDVVRKTTSTNF